MFCHDILSCPSVRNSASGPNLTGEDPIVRKLILLAVMIGAYASVASFAWADDDPRTAKDRASCEEGMSLACFRMGERYRVVEQDNKTAIKFFRKACSADLMTGCTHGGILLFMQGTHSSSQWKEAKKMFTKACDGDYMTGCTNGGILLFMQGTHSSSQWKKAKKMFTKACDAGEDPSCYNLGTLNYKEGRQSKAIKFYHKACEMGNAGGCAREKRLKR